MNEDLSRRAPPPVPDDPSYWPYFLYFTGEVFGESALVEAARLDELKALISGLKPAQQWSVLLTATYWIKVQTSGASLSPVSSSGFATSVTLGPSNNRVLLVATSLDLAGTAVTAVTFGGVAMSLVVSLRSYPGSDGTTDVRW